MRGMLDGTEPTATGDHYHAKDTRNLPAPVQEHLPICIGGGGEQVTLKLVAKYGDMNNVGGGVETVRRKDEILVRHCETVGRDPAEIERTTGIGTVFIRDDRAEAERLFREAFERNRVASHWKDQPVGTPEDVAEKLAPYLDLGYRHLIAGMPSDYDEESMVRFATEVKPLLERISSAPWASSAHLRSSTGSLHGASSGSAAPWRGCRTSSCRTSGAGRRGTCPRTPSGTRRSRRPGTASVSPAAIASTSGSTRRASASAVASASWRWPTTTPAIPARSSMCGAWARTSLRTSTAPPAGVRPSTAASQTSRRAARVACTRASQPSASRSRLRAEGVLVRDRPGSRRRRSRPRWTPGCRRDAVVSSTVLMRSRHASRSATWAWPIALGWGREG